jgi:hypothetical protein
MPTTIPTPLTVSRQVHHFAWLGANDDDVLLPPAAQLGRDPCLKPDTTKSETTTLIAGNLPIANVPTTSG